MADNTLLNSGSGGDTIRDLDRGTGSKTQVVQLDIGGTSTNAENLVTGFLPTAKTEDSGTIKPITLNEDLETLVNDGDVLQELQEIKLAMQEIVFLLKVLTN